MPFISETEERAQAQNAIYDDGSLTAGFSETFDAAVGFALDEGLSTSRMLNNEMYDRRRSAAKDIFDSGVDRGQYTNENGVIDFNEMSRKYETIETDLNLYNQKKMLLSERRKYYTDVMRRSDSITANLLGSMTGYMLDPINVATMAIGTPFAVAKGVSVLGKAAYGAAGAATINVLTEAAIQPLVLDYKLDIDSPYGMEDAITNIAMAAGGGFVLGGMTGGISGWLKKIRGGADNIKLKSDMDVGELKVAVEQIDEMIETLKGNEFLPTAGSKISEHPSALGIGIKIKSSNARLTGTVKGDEFHVSGVIIKDPAKRGMGEGVKIYSDAINEAVERGLKRFTSDNTVDIPAARVWASLKKRGVPVVKHKNARLVKSKDGDFWTVKDDSASVYSIDLEKMLASSKKAGDKFDYYTARKQAFDEIKEGLSKEDLSKIKRGKLPKHVVDKVDERVHMKKVESEAAYLRATEEERTNLNRGPADIDDIEMKIITDNDLDGVYRAMDDPKVIIDGELTSAKKVIQNFDDDIEALEAMKVCISG